jgi:hypothetical protein
MDSRLLLCVFLTLTPHEDNHIVPAAREIVSSPR